MQDGLRTIAPELRAALRTAARHIRRVARRQVPRGWRTTVTPGVEIEQRVTPLDRVGCYVPAGRYPLPSSLLMTVIPARVAGVPEVIVVCPRPDPTVLAAAALAGATRLFRLGGAHAVAALAYGTATVPKVDKIVGPGSVWVAAAKRLVYGEVGIDAEAGPTEVCIVADSSATPAWLAADLISQAEHDELAQSILITHLKGLASKVSAELTKQLRVLERKAIAEISLRRRGAIVLTRNLAESIALANEYAAEHLVLAVDDPDAALALVTNAGAVFLGHYTPVAVGDYLAGPNHVLPTGGTARFFSPLGVEDFLKRTSVVRFEASKLKELGGDVIRLSEIEGLGGHGRSVALRLEKIRRQRRERDAERGKDESEL
ncbi:MAG TPA: histidinol dehydrogenase [Erythrobacter sp.]|nr:histidinol dehydrogenase [Erythrobacter sp.]